MTQIARVVLHASASVQQSPIIVKLVEPKEQSIYDVLFGALGLTGMLTLVAVVLAVLLGAGLFWIRSRQRE